MRANSLAFRLVVGAGMWISVAIIAGGVTLSAIFRDHVEHTFDAQLLVYLDALVSVVEVDDRGRVRVMRPLALGDPRYEQPYSGWHWQISGAGGPMLRSRSLWDQVLPPDLSFISDPAAISYRTQVIQSRQLRIVGRDVNIPGTASSLKFQMTGDRASIEADIQSFNTTLAWSLGLFGCGLILAVFIQVRYGLLPLRRISMALSAIRSGRKSKLTGQFPSEIEPLASEINTLLKHNEEVLGRARTHVGNLAHALKTPISVLANESGSKTSSLADTVEKQTTIMRRHVDHYLSQARIAASSSVLGACTGVMPVIEDLRRTLKRIHAERSIELEVRGDPDTSFRGERHDLEEMLGNLIDNACKWAHAQVWITMGVEGADLKVTIEDDGPGLVPEKHDEVFNRGHRLDETTPGSGLGLAIVRDTAGLYGGDITLSESDLGGLKVLLTLPAAEKGEE
ncbi:MAG: HAMP domain-containing sensor histidine kinase [Alphaproteobacteria bacterium]|nr:HAMP domain-containing sensor histidine kinase [Alphaproteobacteria bacterium]MDP7183278.1 HAMP domain-containing sensor histidine kinase [Alphaproteobacteria bacterium]MDP7191245.1 HAMP domain-containing sensor histidine kinase [Alphaproteobacteria bacterium]MDP7456854.1 HAMP domain-containing sensor histidine kinase [Alphaproteobacteria bacterium]HJO88626.1 HAMP domain-containing sensor histidine kinase [Alphaproteobacteria bacterium]